MPSTQSHETETATVLPAQIPDTSTPTPPQTPSSPPQTASSPPQHSEANSLGRRVFHAIRAIREWAEPDYKNVPTVVSKMGDAESGHDHAMADAMADAASSSTTTTTASSTTPSMERVMPLATWRKMRSVERHQFLDQFYPIREKYRMEREGEEQCAREQLALYECARKRSVFGGMMGQGSMSGSASADASESTRNARHGRASMSALERLDPCVHLRHECRRCVEVMTMAAKTRAVFGREFTPYLRAVDTDSMTMGGEGGEGGR